MDTQENLLDSTNNLIYLKLSKNIAFKLMKNIENICRNFDTFRNKALINFVLTETYLFLIIKLEKLDNLFSIQIQFNNEITLNNINFVYEENGNNKFLIKLNIFRNFLKSLNFKIVKDMECYLFFDHRESKFITRVEYFDENEVIKMENCICSLMEIEEEEFEIDLNNIWSAEVSASGLFSNLKFARENFLKDNSGEGCNFKFMLSDKEKYKYNKIIKITFFKTNEKREMAIEVPFYELYNIKEKNRTNNNNSLIKGDNSFEELEEDSVKTEDESQYRFCELLEDFETNNFQKVYYDSKHIINFLNCFSPSDSKFVLSFLKSKGIKLDIEVEAGFRICYMFPNKGAL